MAFARILSLFLLCCLAGPAAALSLIRDAEIEHTLDRLAEPLLRAAGLNPASVEIYIVQSGELNAFVAGGQNIFIHSGLIARLEGVDALKAVIAHEIGHIAGGHLARRDEALRGARGVAALGAIGAAAAALGGAPEAGMALATGAGQAASRSALAHNRAEEASADQAGLRYMTASGADPAAVLEVLKLFRGQEVLSGRYSDAYSRTHPMWADRIAYLEERIASLPRGSGPSATDVYWHGRMVAKFRAFLDAPSTTLSRLAAADGSEFAVLARAIAYHRLPRVAEAIAHADALIAARPEDAYYHELKGQILLESGRATEASAAYGRAAALAPDEPQILGGLGRALLNRGDAEGVAEARRVLNRSAVLDGDNSGVLRDLALAEARMGNEGLAALATAERFALEGRFADALQSAGRAAAVLPTGSPGWQRAQDVISQARRATN